MGRFLDDYRPGAIYGAVFAITLNEAGAVDQVSLAQVIDPALPKGKSASLSPPSIFFDKSEPGKEFYTYFPYNPVEPTRLDTLPK